jgi:hypothetical protein
LILSGLNLDLLATPAWPSLAQPESKGMQSARGKADVLSRKAKVRPGSSTQSAQPLTAMRLQLANSYQELLEYVAQPGAPDDRS